jgi:hypothetical protein
MASQPVLPDEILIRRTVVGDPPRIAQCPKTASLLERLSVSKFPFRHPVLYGLLLELRSFSHRILCLGRQGDIRALEIGLVYQRSFPETNLVLNRRTQARTQDIRKLLSDSPWLTTEDCRLFLTGWDRGQEYGEGSGTLKNSGHRDYSSIPPMEFSPAVSP